MSDPTRQNLTRHNGDVAVGHSEENDLSNFALPAAKEPGAKAGRTFFGALKARAMEKREKMRQMKAPQFLQQRLQRLQRIKGSSLAAPPTSVFFLYGEAAQASPMTPMETKSFCPSEGEWEAEDPRLRRSGYESSPLEERKAASAERERPLDSLDTAKLSDDEADASDVGAALDLFGGSEEDERNSSESGALTPPLRIDLKGLTLDGGAAKGCGKRGPCGKAKVRRGSRRRAAKRAEPARGDVDLLHSSSEGEPPRLGTTTADLPWGAQHSRNSSKGHTPKPRRKKGCALDGGSGLDSEDDGVPAGDRSSGAVNAPTLRGRAAQTSQRGLRKVRSLLSRLRRKKTRLDREASPSGGPQGGLLM